MEEELISLSNKILVLFMQEIQESINKQKQNSIKKEYDSILDDIFSSLELSKELILRGKIASGMLILRSAYELILIYFLIINSIEHEKSYLDLNIHLNQKKIREDVSKYICIDAKELDETYSLLCEYAHPTVIRNTFINIEKNSDDREFLLITQIFNFNTILNEFLNMFSNKKEESTRNGCIFLYFACIVIYLKNEKLKEKMKKYENFLRINNENKEYFDEKSLNLQKDFLDLCNDLENKKDVKIEITDKYKDIHDEIIILINKYSRLNC